MGIYLSSSETLCSPKGLVESLGDCLWLPQPKINKGVQPLGGHPSLPASDVIYGVLVSQSLVYSWGFSFPAKVKGLAVPVSLTHHGWFHVVSVCLWVQGELGRGIDGAVQGPMLILPAKAAFLCCDNLHPPGLR